MQKRQRTTAERASHWDSAHTRGDLPCASWYQDVPSVSLELIEALGVSSDAAVIDVGGGASTLVSHLVERDFVDLTVLDVSVVALVEGRRRVGEGAHVNWLHEDLLVWQPERRYGLWHDRAVFHFLVAAEDRNRYVQTLRSAIQDDGFVVLATFAADGPEFCSGLPVIGYSVEALVRLLGPGFELQETRREEHITPAGVMQPFTWVAGQMRSG